MCRVTVDRRQHGTDNPSPGQKRPWGKMSLEELWFEGQKDSCKLPARRQPLRTASTSAEG